MTTDLFSSEYQVTLNHYTCVYIFIKSVLIQKRNELAGLFLTVLNHSTRKAIKVISWESMTF